MIRSVWVRVLPVAFAAMLFLPAAHAQSSESWQFEVTPYFWASDLKGHSKIGPLPKADIDLSFDDIWDNLDAAFMGSFEARKGRWSILFDSIYMKLAADADTPGPLFNEGKATVDQQLYTLAATYRVFEEGPTTVDLVGGIRYFYMKLAVKLTPGLLAGRSDSDHADWVDGLVGLRVQQALNENWTLFGYSDAGTGGSNLTWQWLAGLRYDFSKTYSANFGYRFMSIDYDEDNFEYDAHMKGVFAGLNIRF